MVDEASKGADFIVSELLSELKADSARKTQANRSLQKALLTVVALSLFFIVAVVSGFLWYLNQYDFSSSETTTNSAEGVYAIVDSEGNVIGADFTAEEIQRFLEEVELNGESE